MTSLLDFNHFMYMDDLGQHTQIVLSRPQFNMKIKSCTHKDSDTNSMKSCTSMIFSSLL